MNGKAGGHESRMRSDIYIWDHLDWVLRAKAGITLLEYTSILAEYSLFHNDMPLNGLNHDELVSRERCKSVVLQINSRYTRNTLLSRVKRHGTRYKPSGQAKRYHFHECCQMAICGNKTFNLLLYLPKLKGHSAPYRSNTSIQKLLSFGSLGMGIRW